MEDPINCSLILIMQIISLLLGFLVPKKMAKLGHSLPALSMSLNPRKGRWKLEPCYWMTMEKGQ